MQVLVKLRVSDIMGMLNYLKHIANISALIFLIHIFLYFSSFLQHPDPLIMGCNNAYLIGLNELKFISFNIKNGAFNVALITKPVVINNFLMKNVHSIVCVPGCVKIVCSMSLRSTIISKHEFNDFLLDWACEKAFRWDHIEPERVFG